MPTAHTSVAETAATPRRTSAELYSVSTFGLVTTLHAPPSQCSASVRYEPSAPVCEPTAHTSDGESAATPSSVFTTLSGPVLKLGLGTMLHPTPFQCSTSVFIE